MLLIPPMEHTMLIVEAQVHIWERGVPTNRAHRQISWYSKDDLLKEMDEAGVDAAVIHPPGWDPNPNEVAIEAARPATPVPAIPVATSMTTSVRSTMPLDQSGCSGARTSRGRLAPGGSA